jgi:hypothetical protein
MTHTMHKRFKNFKGAMATLTAMALVSTGVLLMTPAAKASTLPGSDGRVAFLDPDGCGPILGVQGYNVAYKAGDGSGTKTTLTTTCDYQDWVNAANPNAPGGPSWNASGTALVAHRLGTVPSGTSGLYVINLNALGTTSSIVQIYKDTGSNAGGSHDPAFGLASNVVAFAVNPGGSLSASNIYTVPASGALSAPSVLASTFTGFPADDPAYNSPAGNCVFFVERIAGQDPIERQCTGGTAQYITTFGGGAPDRNSPTGEPGGPRVGFSLAAAISGVQVAYVTPPNTSETGILGSAGGCNPSWSPSRLLFAVDNCGGPLGIVVGPVAGGTATPLDPIPGALQPDWTRGPAGQPGVCNNDVDGDGIANANDPDDDNDTIADVNDADDDNDGVADVNDNDCPPPALCDNDADGDGVKNGVDNDDDNDTVLDANDTDDDGDGIADANDTDTDSDCDGISNNVDDDDNDGVLDNDEGKRQRQRRQRPQRQGQEEGEEEVQQDQEQEEA